METQVKRKASPVSTKHKKFCAALAVGDLLHSSKCDYRITEFLGKGSFGQVFRCRIGTSQTQVAIKYIVRETTEFEEQEVKFLKQIRSFADEYHLLALHETFTHGPHLCIVVEGLDCSLNAFLSETCQLPIPGMRAIVGQLLSAANKLKALGIIHTDIKPDNIMMVDRHSRPYSIKLIDFGSCLDLAKYYGKVITGWQTMWYRSPEMILGLPCTDKVDSWSIGCVAAEIIRGIPLYPGVSESHMLQYMIDTQGMFDESIKENAKYFPAFFEEKGGIWTLKSTSSGSKHEGHQYDDLVELADEISTEDQIELEDVNKLIILVKGLLALNPEDRLSAKDGLRSNLFTMSRV